MRVEVSFSDAGARSDPRARIRGRDRRRRAGDAWRRRARTQPARASCSRAVALRATLAMLGPAFVASVAYVDPGNFATNIQGGAKFGYLLLWVVLLANLMAMLIQYLSAKLGIVTERSLPEVCRERMPRVDERRAVGAGRADGDGHRHRRVPGRRGRAEPPVRRAAADRRPDHRRDRVRDPRAPGARLPPVRARDRRLARARARRVPVRDAPDRPLGPPVARTDSCPASAAPARCTSRSGSSAPP